MGGDSLGLRGSLRTFLRTDFYEGVGDCCDESVDGSGGGLSQQGFELVEELLDRVEVGAVGRQRPLLA